MSTPRSLHRRLLDSSEHGLGLDVLLGAIFSGLARACWPSPGQITETGKFAKLDSFLQESTQPVHKRSGPMIDFKCPKLWNLFNSGIDPGSNGKDHHMEQEFRGRKLLVIGGTSGMG